MRTYAQSLTRRGFLRRNFETVREFEMAIRGALPISEASLVSLDRIFEEARYSSHVLGDAHRDNAQLALSSVVDEIERFRTSRREVRSSSRWKSDSVQPD